MSFSEVLFLFDIFGVFARKRPCFIAWTLCFTFFSFYNLYLAVDLITKLNLNRLTDLTGITVSIFSASSLVFTFCSSLLHANQNSRMVEKVIRFDEFMFSKFGYKDEQKLMFWKYLALLVGTALMAFSPLIFLSIFPNKPVSFAFNLQMSSFYLLIATQLCFLYLVDLINCRLEFLCILSKRYGCRLFILRLHSKLLSISTIINDSFGKVMCLLVVVQCLDAVMCCFWLMCAFLKTDHFNGMGESFRVLLEWILMLNFLQLQQFF